MRLRVTGSLPTGAAMPVARWKRWVRVRTSSTIRSWRGSFVGTFGITRMRAFLPPLRLSTIPAIASRWPAGAPSSPAATR